MRSKTGQRGFTLVEVMIVVAIIGILSAIAIPNISSWLPNIRLKAAARDLYSDLMQAKGEAVRRNVNCAITFNQQVAGTPFAYIVYVDADRDCEFDAAEIIIARMQQWPQNVALDTSEGGGDGLSFTDNDDGNPTIVFRQNAIPAANAGAIPNGTAFLISSSGLSRVVVVNRAGSISIQ